eukprot:10926408-Lingulodinium_polyedra.AAC.1
MAEATHGPGRGTGAAALATRQPAPGASPSSQACTRHAVGGPRATEQQMMMMMMAAMMVAKMLTVT